MNKENISKFIINSSMSIVDAMSKIDINTKGVVFVVDDGNALIGCVSDGDIRRWLLKTGNLNVTVDKVMTTSPKFLYCCEREHAYKLMSKYSIYAIPIINEEKIIVDIVFLTNRKNQSLNKNNGSLANVNVVIMAGGKGTRLYPYTKILPKPLIPIGETPIVERIIDCFTQFKIDNFYMTVNYKKSMIKSYFSEIQHDYSINYVDEDLPLGTAGSLKLINKTFDSPLFVTNCDSLILADYSDVYDYHINSNNAITVVASLKNTPVPYGVLHTQENGELIGIEEKPKISHLINTGMYIINQDVISEIPNNTVFHMTHLIERIMEKGEKVGVYPISEESFLDMGEFDEMRRMEEKLSLLDY